MRLDVKLHELYPAFSRAVLQRFISEGKVKVSGIVETKTKKIVNENDKIELDESVLSVKKIANIELPVLYEDLDCVVIDKPAGILTHSKGSFNSEPTVATWLAKRVKSFSGNRDGIVHRLDRGTSGVMICAKNSEALAWLQKQFSTRKTKKTYNAIIEGEIDPEEAVIDVPIERNPKKPQRFRTNVNGKQALTYYKILKKINAKSKVLSLLELKPKTGRTHQLRVHLNHLKHPIVGDDFYSGLAADRLYLHATVLEITLPNHERKVFVSPLPKKFLKPSITQ